MIEPSATPEALPPPEPQAQAQGTGAALRLLDAVRQAQHRALRAQGLLLAVAAFFALLLLSGLAGASSPRAGQWLLALTATAPLLVFAGFALVLARARVGDLDRTARLLAERVPELSLDMLAAVELSRALGERHDFSPALARAFLQRLDDRATRHDPRALLDSRPTQRAALALLGVVLLGGAVLGFKGARVRAGLVASVSVGTARPTLAREPITGDFELTYRYPAYTGLESRTETGTSGEVRGPAGTEVALKTHADREVGSAALVVNDARVPLTRQGRELKGSFVLEKSGAYHVIFLDGRSVVAEGPDLSVTVEADTAPQVRLTAPVDGLELEEDKQKVTLKYEATDDYGIAALELVYRPSGAAEERVVLKPDDGRATRGQYVWDLASLHLVPGRPMSYFVEAKDNDAVAGAKKGQSQTQTLKVYSAAEHRREALKRAQKLWGDLVDHLADRLESTDRKPAPGLEPTRAGLGVDARAEELVQAFDALATELDKERDPPDDLLGALKNISLELGHDVSAVKSARRLYLRFLTSDATAAAREMGGRLNATVAVDIAHSEKNALYLEALLDRHRMEELKTLARELKQDRKQLSEVLSQYAKTPDEKTREALLRQMEDLKARIRELQERMGELAKGIHDEHMNQDALAEMMEEKDLTSALDEVEKLVREGKVEEAMKKMAELSMQMDSFLEDLEAASDEAESEADPELTEKFEKFTEELEETAKSQEALAEKSKEVRDKYRDVTKERIAQQGKVVKRDVEAKLEELKRSLDSVEKGRVSDRFDEQRAEARRDVDSTKQALEADDFSLAADSAGRLERATQEMAGMAQQQRLMEETFPTPPEHKKAARQLEEKLSKDARKANEVAERLRGLFPRGGMEMGESDRKQMDELSKQQRKLQKKADQLSQQMEDLNERAPVFDEDAKQQLDQAAQRMSAADERLRGKDPSRAHGEQQGAAQALRGLQQQVQQGGEGKGGKGGMPRPKRMRRGGRGGTSNERVEIPDEDPNQAPREFRKDVMDAMKQGAPSRYQDQNKRYYEELVK